jgi:hypothetical protein
MVGQEFLNSRPGRRHFNDCSISSSTHLAPGGQADRDLCARERVLNSAIIAADISEGWEEYLEIFDAFYADDVEVTTETETNAVRNGFAHSFSVFSPRSM